jgi:hypothetical protein
MQMYERHALLGSRGRPVNIDMEICVSAFADHEVLSTLTAAAFGASKGAAHPRSGYPRAAAPPIPSNIRRVI